MAVLNISAVGRVPGYLMCLYISVTHADGTPVVGLTSDNFQVKFAYQPYPQSIVDVPDTVTYPAVNEDGYTYTDENGNQVMATSPMIWPQGLPGFYGMVHQTTLQGYSGVFQISVEANGDHGQTLCHT